MNQDKLKILLIDEGLNTGLPEASKIGGGQLSRWRLFSQKDFFEVTVLTSEPDIANLWRDSAKIVFNAKMHCYRPPRSQISFKLTEMRKLFKESIRSARVLTHELSFLKYDVIFLNDNKSRLLYIMSSIMRINRLPKAVTAIEMDTEWNQSPYDKFIKIIYLIFFDKILCPSEATKMKLGLIGKLSKNKLQVAYPLVDSIGSLVENNRYKDGKKKLVFANIGTVWFKIKGQDIIVDAIEKLVKGRNDVPIEVRFYGDGPDLSELKRIIKERNLENYLKVLGREVDQNTIYADIQGCIIASRTETASMVLIECLQRNIPVIVSKLEPLLEIKKLFYNGLSFRSGDFNDLAAVLTKTLDTNILNELHEILKKLDKNIIALKNQVKLIYGFLKGC
jgi:glycosyltransferase involved in cell wall biosynthesis